jgi:hypothetical protein
VKAAGRAAVLGRNLGNGLVEFKLGNVPGGDVCSVEVKYGFTASSSGPSSMFFKFPLDTCTTMGSTQRVGSLVKGAFHFSLRNCDAAAVSNISSNVPGTYSDGVYAIADKPSVSSLIVTTELRRPLSNECVADNHTLAASYYVEDFGSGQERNNEFVFVVDCSGSMGGTRIRQARDCLQIFIRSLPSNSVFDIIRFGSSFDSLFEKSAPYNEGSAAKALVMASNLQANLGGTDLFRPLSHIYSEPHSGVGNRQIFVLTDGEVDNTDRVLELSAANRNRNRVFTIGIGGADAGLVEGLANATGGRWDFVHEGEDLSSKVIPQLQTSLSACLSDVQLHVAGASSIDVSPFPISLISKSISLH